jgi:hypothetical protein
MLCPGRKNQEAGRLGFLLFIWAFFELIELKVVNYEIAIK